MHDIMKGMRVVEASAFIAAPYAGLTLAQMGAEVIRIDPIGGGLDFRRWPLSDDGTSLYWTGLNKGKRSVALDMRSDEGREIATALATQPGEMAGILVTNLPPRGWLDYAALKARREDMIMASIVGNRDGSVALDYTINAAAGFPLVTGPEDKSAPTNHVMPVWDVVAALTVVNGILTAERRRRETGEGDFIQLALSDTAFSTLSHLGFIAEVQATGHDRPKTGNHVYGTFARDFATKDGRRVMITAFTPRHWSALVEVTGTARLMQTLEEIYETNLKREENRYEHRNAIAAFLEPWFAKRDFKTVCKALEEAGCCWGPYNTFRQAVEEDPRVSTANPMFDEIDQPGVGRILAAGAMLEFGGIPRVPVQPAPRLGQDTDAVLAEVLGMSEGEIGKLHDKKVVAGPN